MLVSCLSHRINVKPWHVSNTDTHLIRNVYSSVTLIDPCYVSISRWRRSLYSQPQYDQYDHVRNISKSNRNNLPKMNVKIKYKLSSAFSSLESSIGLCWYIPHLFSYTIGIIWCSTSKQIYQCNLHIFHRVQVK